jgi:hypothetical protein
MCSFQIGESAGMSTRTRNFPGADRELDDLMTLDVAADEKAAIDAVCELRRINAISFETIEFVLGSGSGQISRYLNQTKSVTLTDYLRIARCLGYRCRTHLEKMEDGSEQSIASLNNVSHRTMTFRRHLLRYSPNGSKRSPSEWKK